MNNAEYKGEILEISPVKTFVKNGKKYSYRIVVLTIGDYFVAANYWLSDKLPPVGSFVTFTIKISSERNSKAPEQFYHKVTLQSIYESSRIPSEVLN